MNYCDLCMTYAAIMDTDPECGKCDLFQHVIRPEMERLDLLPHAQSGPLGPAEQLAEGQEHIPT